jgi:UDP-N-acetylmuramate dehydrogenase
VVLQSDYLDHYINFDTEQGILHCEAGLSLHEILNCIIPKGWFLPVTPGSGYVTIGGAVAMNAGCYGFEVKDVLSWVEIIDDQGMLHKLLPHEINMSYRKSVLPIGCVIVRAAFKITKGNALNIQQNIQRYLQLREESQPTKGRTGGSTFKNPDYAKAWELIDKAGCRGITIGAAKISEKHCNFMLNTGGASANELERLGELVRQKVKQISEQELEWEIIRIGRVA